MKIKTLGALAVATALTLASPASAEAKPKPPKVKTLTAKLAAPFNVALNKGHVYIADGGVSKVFFLTRRNKLRTLEDGPQPGDVAGIDLSPDGKRMAYTSTHFGPGGATLNIVGPGKRHRKVSLSKYEAKKNPDQRISYGIRKPSQCVKDAIAGIPDGPPVTYKGLVDSHPYSVAWLGSGKWAVADAGGNDLLTVNRKGKVRTLSVLPKQPLKFTARTADAMRLPHCVIGWTYNFEAVPTDVEVGADGWLYVSTLAGGPEDPRLGARSAVYRVNPKNGKAEKIASQLSGATNLALDKDGKIYVAEFYAGRISVIKHRRPRTFVKLPGALSVEAKGRTLWAGTMASDTDPGTLVRVKQRR